MPNLSSPPALRAAYQAAMDAAAVARRLRHLDAREDGRYPRDSYDNERAGLRLRENAEVRRLSEAAHMRLWGVRG